MSAAISSPTPDRLRLGVLIPILIAIVSALGALGAWRAAVVSIRGSDLNEDGLLELVQREQRLVQLEAMVAEDEALFAEWRQHVTAWELLTRDARQAKDPQEERSLQLQAQTELAAARSMLPFFRAGTPELSRTGSTTEFDRASVLRVLRAVDPLLRDLRPDASFRLARDELDRSVTLVLVVALLIASLFFLTLAQFAGAATQVRYLGAGVIVGMAASTLFVLVSVGG